MPKANDTVRDFHTVAEFDAFLDTLFLTDRQKEIAKLKYLRGWAHIDIAAELDISRRTVTEELSKIRHIFGSTK